MSPRYILRPHDLLQIGAVVYRFLRSTELGLSFAGVEDPNDERFYSHREFETLMTQPGARVRRDESSSSRKAELLRTAYRYMSTMPINPQARLTWRLRYVQHARRLHAQGLIRRREEPIRRAMPQLAAAVDADECRNAPEIRGGTLLPPRRKPPSPRALLQWWRDLERADDNPLALARKKGSGRKAVRLQPDVERIVAHEIGAFYLTRQRPSPQDLMVRIEDRIAQENQARAERWEEALACPSGRAVAARLRAIDPFERCAQRHGVEAAKRRFGLYEGGVGAELIGERVEIDEWNIDLLGLMNLIGAGEALEDVDRARLQAVRLWMYAAIDCASRCVLSFKLCFAPMSGEALQALELITIDKTELARAAGCECAWDQHCGVGDLVSDQGPAFVSEAFITAAADLGWRPTAPAAGNPELRGTIERLFRTFGYLLMPMLSGRTFGDTRARGDYPAEAWAALDEDALTKICVRFIVDIYHNRAHSGLGGETPADAWTRLARERGVLPPPDATTRMAVFGLPLERRIGRHGVRFAGFDYTGDIIGRLLLHGHDRLFQVRVDPNDLGWIVIGVDGDWEPLRAVSPSARGLSWADWREMTLRIRERNRAAAALTEDVVRRARADIAAENAAARTRRRLGPWSITVEQVRRAEDEVFLGLSIRGPAAQPPEPSGAAADLFSTEIRAPQAEADPSEPPADDAALRSDAPPPAPWRFLEED